MKITALVWSGLVLPLALVAAEKKPVDVSKIPLPVPRKVDFVKEVYPIFKDACISCHGPEKQKGKYRMDSKEAAFKDTDYGPTIIPGKSAESSLIHMVCNLVDEMMMPPPSDKPGKSEPLTKEQIGILRAWIDQGAEWVAGADSYVKPVTFAVEIQPIFQRACGSCHGAETPKGEFAATTLEAVLKGGKGYGKVVTPGDVKKSSLVTIVSGLDEDLPQADKHKLAPKEIELVKKWIELGAK